MLNSEGYGEMAETAARPTGRMHGESDQAELVSPERLIYFSDAVIAIAITLLALELPVPHGEVHGNDGVLHFLREHLTEYVAFLISFSAVAMHWLFHQRLFRYAKGLTGSAIHWNLLWLLMIVIMPFATKLLTSEADAFQIQFTAYAAAQALAGLFLWRAFSALRRGGLLKDHTPPAVITNTLSWNAAVVVTFAASIPVALVTHSASLCWTLLPAVRFALRFARPGRR
ncbi:TMEM175 family protein [Kitasatospora sp. NPDC097643]|uniref:TMEM175 family protein n=1 Tax=Kitasatospora sp. NPDC097643 TaxID=3157230 RepID=UPI00332E0035